jgi:uncharacterized protein YcaQ
MTTSRRKGQHLYDLAERVVPPEFLKQPELSEDEAVDELIRERHRACGLIRPSAPFEIWSYQIFAPQRNRVLGELCARSELLPIEIEGMKAHASPEFLKLLDAPALEPKVRFLAPLDQILWDRKMVTHVFDFDYIWEIYTPEVKRKWGYYVLPVMFGDAFAGRAEFWCRNGVLELRRWHNEPASETPNFMPELEAAMLQFMGYCRSAKMDVDSSVDPKVRKLVKSLRR